MTHDKIAPYPWQIHESVSTRQYSNGILDGGFERIQDHSGRFLTEVHRAGEYSIHELMPTVRTILKAPEMLEVLEQLVGWDTSSREVSDLEAIISYAKTILQEIENETKEA